MNYIKNTLNIHPDIRSLDNNDITNLADPSNFIDLNLKSLPKCKKALQHITTTERSHRQNHKSFFPSKIIFCGKKPFTVNCAYGNVLDI